MTYASEVLADSPLGYWRLGEPSGTTIVDSSGNSRGGTYSATGVTLAQTGLLSGDSDTAALFSGAGSGSAASSALVTYGAWMSPTFLSFEILAKPTSVTGQRMIMGRSNLGSINTTNYQGYIYQDGTSYRFFTLTSTGTNNFCVASGAAAIGVTTHLVGTWDGTNVRLYVNGVEAASAALAGTAVAAGGTQALGIGRVNYTSTGQKFAGTLDEAAMYGTALSSGRVAAHYAATGLGPPPPASAWVSRGLAQVLQTVTPDARVSRGLAQVLQTVIPDARTSRGLVQVLTSEVPGPEPTEVYVRSVGSSDPVLMKQPGGEWWPVEAKA